MAVAAGKGDAAVGEFWRQVVFGGRAGRAFPFVLFWLAFLPRVLGLVARSTEWHERGILFMRAIAAQEWRATLLAPHPGVITMWLVGSVNSLGRVLIADFTNLPRAQKMALEVIPLALVISLMIVLAYVLLRRLFDGWAAAVAATLLAIDPFHIFVSKTLHVDGLMSVFLMISSLYMLLFTSDRQRRWLRLSAIFAGLALLNKTPALFLVPYLLLCLAASEVEQWLAAGSEERFAKGRLWQVMTDGLGNLAGWLLVIAVLIFLLWPAMWVNPAEALAEPIAGTIGYANAPHPKVKLFMGELIATDPGLPFYLVSMLAKTTVVTLLGFILCLVSLANRRLDRRRRLYLLLMLALVAFFTIQMTLGQKKSPRYLLPAFQFVTLMAGLGAAYHARWLFGNPSWAHLSALMLVIGGQFITSIPRHPYYGTHYNWLFGGPKAVLNNRILAGQEQGEGMDIAAAYLNQKPLSSRLVVGLERRNPFEQQFAGKLVSSGDPRAHYVVMERNSLVRASPGDALSRLWKQYQVREAELVISFDDVPYVWVYKVGPAMATKPLTNVVQVNVGSRIRLVAYSLEPKVLSPGESLELSLQWQALEKPQGDYKVFAHLLGPKGNLWGQQDGRPQAGAYATYLWEAGEQVQDAMTLPVPAEAPAGSYQVAVGMYDPETMQRLRLDRENHRLLDDRFLIPGVTVAQPEE